MIPRKPILIMSNAIVDDIWFADGIRHAYTLGGAALYAAVAASMWWDNVAVVSGVGADFEQIAGAVLTAHNLRREGLVTRDAHTIQSTLVYSADGERTETPVYGADHFARLQLVPDDIPSVLLPAAATYIFRDLWPTFWESYNTVRDDLGIVMWELQGNAAEAANLGHIEQLLKQVDVFSLNLTEARRLLGTENRRLITERILDTGVRVVLLRMGGEGALISDGRELLYLTPPVSRVVDVTGGGNSFCGGFLAGLCTRSEDIEHAARCAAASAAVSIAQQGLPRSLNRQLLGTLYSGVGIRRQPIASQKRTPS